MSKFLYFLLIILLQNSLSDLDDVSQKINLTEVLTTSYTNSIKWIGFSLPSPHIITKISWIYKDNFTQNEILGIFEGSNEPNFIDSIPLYVFIEESTKNFINIELKYTFKYIRYIAPLKKDVHITNIEIYGYEPLETEQNVDNFYHPTNLPLVIINTEGKMNYEQKEEKTPCNVVIINDGKMSTKQSGKAKIRGNGTKNLQKKSFQINLDIKENILDMPAKAKKWVLLANHMDKTLIRNLVAFKVASLLGQKYSPACKSVDLIIDGSFEGNYLLCDKIEKGENRVELDSMDKNANEIPEITGGYLLEVDAYADEEEYHFYSKKGVKVTVKYPDANENQMNYIKNWFDNIEENIYNSQNVDNIDLESFSQYFILEEFCADIDAVWSSYYITKQKNDDMMYFGPAWDFDLALDNDKRLYPTNNLTKFIFNYGPSSGTFKIFISKLINCEQTLEYVKEKWVNITLNDLTKENIFNFIDEQVTYLDKSVKLNFKRWDILTLVGNEAVARGSYEEQIKHLKEFIEERFSIFGNILLNTNTTNTTNTSSFLIDIEVESEEEKTKKKKLGCHYLDNGIIHKFILITFLLLFG